MKKTVACLFISIMLFSCSKEKQLSVVGLWVETANYREITAGVYGWEDVQRWPLHLNMTEDGKYGAFNDVPAGYGEYQYNRSTKELIFKSAPSGFTSMQKVSLLTENLMEIDIVDNGVLLNKLRFIRQQ